MVDQVSGLSNRLGTYRRSGSSGNRAETYESVDILNLQSFTDDFIGKKVLLAGKLFNLESGSGTTYLQVDIPLGENSLKSNLVRVVYHGEVSGLTKGSELRIWGTCAGTCSGMDGLCCPTSFPLVRADFLQWR